MFVFLYEMEKKKLLLFDKKRTYDSDSQRLKALCRLYLG